jgi:hypothetical protein
MEAALPCFGLWLAHLFSESLKMGFNTINRVRPCLGTPIYKGKFCRLRVMAKEKLGSS